MKEAGFIDRNESPPENQDFESLRERAVEYVQSLSGHIWTDHNIHDPGITSLEVLVYALVDLSYRTSFPVEDLLAKSDGSVDPASISGLFPPQEVLPTGPVTVFDLRRLLLKIRGVRNSWCEPLIAIPAEVPFYFDRETKELTYQGDGASPERFQAVHISGLYRALLELEIDDELGSLNEFSVIDRVLDHPTLRGAEIEISPESDNLLTLSEVPAGDFKRVKQLGTVSALDDGSFGTSAVLELNGGEVAISRLIIRLLNAPQAPTQGRIRSWLLSDSTPLSRLWRKYQRIYSVVAKARCALAANRGLTEDMVDVRPVSSDRIGICADIDVEPAADLEAVKAEVIQRIDQYLNPPVQFSSLADLLDDGQSLGDIFNGPYIDWALKCGNDAVFEQAGFVDQKSLEKSQLKTAVYTSDLIEALDGIDGVIAIRSVSLRKPAPDENGNKIVDKWCLPVKPFHQPRLEIRESRIRFYKDGIPLTKVNSREFELSLALLREMARSSRLVVDSESIESKVGKFRDPAAFYSVQEDFPEVYGIGAAGLPDSASKRRLAEAKQFKGYLAIFDQVLADYLAQLSRAGELLSLRDDLDRTFFKGTLEGIPGVQNTLTEELFVAGSNMLDPATRNELVEDDEGFARRRNQALDHLIARFAESFTDYVFLTHDLGGDRLLSDQKLITEKVAFAREYPEISRKRSLGFNYRLQNTWGTKNVSGLEQRVSRLLGIENFRRRDLHCSAVAKALLKAGKDGTVFRVEVRGSDRRLMFSSVQHFSTRGEAIKVALEFYKHLNEARSFKVEKSGTGSWTFSILSPERSDKLTHRKPFATQQEAVEAAHAILMRHNELLGSDEICGDEGFHLIEHILLRPRRKGDPFMGPCIADQQNCCGDQDPFSHRVSVLCPAWPRRFRSTEFRRFFERALRTETPAHIHARICWISNQDMQRLDLHYRRWLDALQRKLASEPGRRRKLIEFLASTESVYPPAELHDCNDDTDSSVPIRLDETKLGLFDL